jgi:hypothetical protein
VATARPDGKLSVLGPELGGMMGRCPSTCSVSIDERRGPFLHVHVQTNVNDWLEEPSSHCEWASFEFEDLVLDLSKGQLLLSVSHSVEAPESVKVEVDPEVKPKVTLSLTAEGASLGGGRCDQKITLKATVR